MIKKSTFSIVARCTLALLWSLIATGLTDAFGQAGTKSVSGKIVDEKGQPLIGVSVVVEGSFERYGEPGPTEPILLKVSRTPTI